MPIIGTGASHGMSARFKPTVTGGTLRSDDTYHYRTFTSNGTFTVSDASLDVSVFVVSGGGGGAGGRIQNETGTCFEDGMFVTCNVQVSYFGGAGAGGLTTVLNTTQLPAAVNIVIGSGGNGGEGRGANAGNGTSGGQGSASTYGGSGPGGGNGGTFNLGGANASHAKTSGLGGSGATAGTTSDTGGAGFTDSTYSASTTTYGVGGSSTVTSNTAAANNTGNGGKGGYGNHAANIVNGGSGIVIVRYLKSAAING
jgi:hypothetical protein